MFDKTPSRRGSLLLLGAAVSALVAGGARAAAPIKVVMHRSPTCGCCGLWAERLQSAGYALEVINESDMSAVKTRLGVPGTMASCHTALVEGYVIEGHVPPLAIDLLLSQRPKATGLAAPGMPGGSPGMESAQKEVFQLYLFDAAGAREYGKWLGEKPV